MRIYYDIVHAPVGLHSCNINREGRQTTWLLNFEHGIEEYVIEPIYSDHYEEDDYVVVSNGKQYVRLVK